MQALTRSRSCLEWYRLPTSSTKMQDLSRKVVQPSDYIVGVDPLEKESRVVAALCVQQGFSMKAKEAFKDLGLLIIFPLVFDKRSNKSMLLENVGDEGKITLEFDMDERSIPSDVLLSLSPFLSSLIAIAVTFSLFFVNSHQGHVSSGRQLSSKSRRFDVSHLSRIKRRGTEGKEMGRLEVETKQERNPEQRFANEKYDEPNTRGSPDES
ncbi:hypothetical protein HZH66_012372 [Vespula vulgaris]|uniref:Uncharacterized protein n=1 Tax=Vespula vulgaris TaxID=7454 RepID=A0A834MSW5_VESVU|nr:hypothetical protein HZH66_012372 [Vespula vulgaris]